MIVTLDNFRDLECNYIKYVSGRKDKLLRLGIIDYPAFKKEMVEEYSDLEVEEFFQNFPYRLYTVENEEDKYFFLKLEIEFYNELTLVQNGGIQYVLFDTSSEIFEDMSFRKKIEDQPLPFEEFVHIAFDDFVEMHTEALLFNIKTNLKKEFKDVKK